MKRLIKTAILAGIVVCQAQAADKIEFKDNKAKLSYTFGYNLGEIWKNQELSVDIDILTKGIQEAMAGTPSQLTETERRSLMATVQAEVRAKMEQKRKALGEKNKAEGAVFLAENKKKPGVIALPDGLQYKIIKDGTGESPSAQDTVSVNYRGTLTDGTEFDSSFSRGQPASFPVNRVVKGWTEALQLMKVGSKWQLCLPPELAYGEWGSGNKIGPNAVLQFEVELLGITKATNQPPPAVNQPVTSDIIKVPSAEELKKGAKIEVIKKEDLDKLQKEK